MGHRSLADSVRNFGFSINSHFETPIFVPGFVEFSLEVDIRNESPIQNEDTLTA